MMKKKTFMLLMVTVMLVMAANASALVPQPAEFTHKMTNISGSLLNVPGTQQNPQVTTWTHTLEKTDFTPNWGPGTIVYSIDSASLLLDLMFTFSAARSFRFKYDIYLDDVNKLGGTVVYHQGSDPAPVSRTTSVAFNNKDLSVLQDLEVMIKLRVYEGTLNRVNASTLSGTATVAPEPASMLLVAVGLAGMPAAVRFRRRRCG